MTMFARRAGGELTDAQRQRIVWELEKYAPAFNESVGTEILALAEPAVATTMSTAQSFDDFLLAAKHHGTRVLKNRDRATLTFVIGAAARTAAMARTLDENDCHFFHDVLHKSQGAYSVDGDFGRVELGQIDSMRHQKDPQGFAALLVAADPEQSRFRVGELAKRPGLPPTWSRGRAFAFLTCSALNVGISGQPDAKATDLANQVHEMAKPMGFADAPLTDADREVARATALHAIPNDPSLFLRTFEDQVSLFVDLDRDKQDTLLKTLNALVADAAPVTAYRRELITVAMAVLALGRAAKWRKRAAPPACVYDG